MRKLVLLFCLIVGQLCFSQQINFDKGKSSLSMDNEIVPYVEEFLEAAQERGFYLRFYLMERIDYILFDDSIGTAEGDNRIGVVGKDKRGFYLSPLLKGNPVKLRVTVYHEIGHIIKNSGIHTCGYCYDIMSETAPKDLKPYLNNKFWNLKVDEYFKWLNER